MEDNNKISTQNEHHNFFSTSLKTCDETANKNVLEISILGIN